MILVTGATGLVGSHLVLHLLEQGHNVRALYRTEENIGRARQVFDYYKKGDLFSKINWFHADIVEVPSLNDAFIGIEYVYHCAALVSFNPDDEDKLRKINIEGTANVVNFCLHQKIKKLCFVSSIAALGDLLEGETVVTESTEWNPEVLHSDYAISKYGAEMEVWRGQQEGLDVVVVNPGVILGPFFWTEGSGEIYQKVKKGMPFYTKGVTGFVCVTDVIKAMVTLMNSEIKNEKFTLVSENLSYEYLVFKIANCFKVSEPKIYANRFITSFGWRVDWLMHLLFGKKRLLTKNIARSLHSIDIYSNEKILKELDFEFLKIKDCFKNLDLIKQS
ncbi:NAD-dependent epimerase/dehydratase family protein [Flavobacterium terrae]|uniref:Nucleoside-diphosphate-sugar epimerase n=1 Tax=Flavobacterium terrae TaxID=415425 RepID=A0A1M6BAM2_9FLAO|nr:NAD-dependent epimerase/dehydratase family protein [Flavobacterium terrae]SHI45736.1 Nucleoside-diphosphate-sugar epimerase [Flavobacterium terrae]